MSVQYGAISWNRQKKVYDLTLVSLLALYLAVFVGVGAWRNPSATAETLLIRALGTAAFLLLNIVLCIGPLARLDRRFLPLLYNRRHLGVTTFLLGLAHGGFALFQFHALGNANPLVSLFIGNPRYGSVADFPFQILGFFALIILFLMAATSHDFWLRNLSAPMWKRLHMLVYVAYALLVAHVTLGALQTETNPVLAAALIVGVSAISNVCQHQNGPLGEGRIIDGCVTCPWHGYQYQPESGAAPAPFKEKIPTFRVKIVKGSVFVHPRPNPPGTRVEPAKIYSTEAQPRLTISTWVICRRCPPRGLVLCEG